MPQEEKSVSEFLAQMDAGKFDGRLGQELAKLSPRQLDRLVEILQQRNDDLLAQDAER